MLEKERERKKGEKENLWTLVGDDNNRFSFFFFCIVFTLYQTIILIDSNLVRKIEFSVQWTEEDVGW